MVKLTVVAADEAFAKLTAAGPLTRVHVTVSVLPCGRPSSLALPAKLVWAVPPLRTAVTSGPALTSGPRLVSLVVMVTATSSEALRAPSLAVSRST